MSTFGRAPEGSYENDAFDPALTEWFEERHRGRQHSRRELEALVRELALRRDLWGPWVAHSAVERIYTRLHLDDGLEVWLICWSRLQDTGFHDHDGSRAPSPSSTARSPSAASRSGQSLRRRASTGPAARSRSAHRTSTT